MEKKETIWSRLASGKLPELETSVSIDKQSIVTFGAVLFLSFFLIFIAYFTLKSRLT